ncbi:MAG TPA: TrkH family potassium uptake protein [Alphaproteobacteria bacterium]|nr:TrkH family potassium uptake protein [Alphaproteobacteria bacterium]
MIHFRPVFFVIGILLTTLAVVMVLPAIADAAVGNRDWVVFATSAGLTLFVGVSLIIGNWAPRFDIEVREAFLLTALAWLVAAAAGALPMAFSGLNLSFTDAYFEAMSGITTTGSTVIVGLDSAPPGILLWRALLQMLGGIGFIVMAVAVLPFLKVGGMQLFRMEFSDKSEKVLPRVAQIAAAIGVIYLVLIALDATALWAAGMTGFEAVCHAMATLATGGFSTSDASIGHFHSLPIEMITTVFMLLGAMPFVLFLELMRGKPGRLFRDSQVRGFLGLYAAAVLALVLWQWLGGGESLPQALREVSFGVASIMTTTGFATADYQTWGGFAAVVVLYITVVGGCTGSTGGGIKIYRLEVLYATAKAQFRRIIQPHGLFEPHYAGRPIPEAVASSVMGFFFLFALTFAALSLGLGAAGLDFLTSISGVATAMANTGPGLGAIIGPAGNFASLPDSAKWLLSLGMLLGRLELYTVLVLLWPEFWRG